MIRFFFIILLTLSCQLHYSQVITGKIINENKENITNGFILLADKNNPARTLHFQQFRAGEFSIDVAKFQDNLLFIAKSNGYLNDTISYNKDKALHSDFLFILKKNITTAIALDEVEIIAKKYPFKIKKDTVVYQVSGYSDGTEVKLEDLLKKLPGIDVNSSTGLIKYKGKSIETIMLEGDNLFGNDYTIGSRNINIDLVNEVEAIENFSENSLLKGMSDKEKVALNLKLKEGVSLSTESNIGLGTINEDALAKDLSAAVLGVSKKVKAFAILSNNNIGINRSSINYYINDNNNESEILPNKIINDYFPINQINKQYNFTNNQYLSDINLIYKAAPKLSLKVNSAFINDNVLFTKYNLNKYLIQNEQFVNEDFFFSTKKIMVFKNNLNANYKLSKNESLEYEFKNLINIHKGSNLIESKSNLINDYNIASKTVLTVNSLLYTNRINNQKVFQISAKSLINSIDEKMMYVPPIIDINNESEKQMVNVSKTSTIIAAKLLGKNKSETDKYSSAIVFENHRSNFGSNRLGFNGNEIFDYVNFNNFTTYKVNNFYNLGKYSTSIENWRLTVDYKMSFLNQELMFKENQINFLKKIDYIFEPNIQLSRKFTKTETLILNASIKRSPLVENYLFIKPILTDNRITTSNILSLKLSENYSYQLMYLKNDMYNNFQNNISIGYQKNSGNMLSESQVNENFIKTRFFFNRVSTDDINVNFMASKLIPLLNTTFKINSNFNYSTFYNTVNNSNLRKNSSQFFENEFFVKTAFNCALNFQNALVYRTNKSDNEEGGSFENNALNNEFKIIFRKTDKFLCTINYSYFLPNNKNASNNYHFLDLLFRYKPSNKKYNISLLANNLSNEKSFSTVQTSDVSLNIATTSIIPRHILIMVDYRF